MYGGCLLCPLYPLLLEPNNLNKTGLKTPAGRRKTVGYLQELPRIWTRENREQIQQVTIAGFEPGTTRLRVQRADHSARLSPPVWWLALHYNQRGLATEPPVSRPPLMSHTHKRHLQLLQSAASAFNESGSTFAEIMSFLHTSLLSIVALDDLIVLVTDRRTVFISSTGGHKI